MQAGDENEENNQLGSTVLMYQQILRTATKKKCANQYGELASGARDSRGINIYHISSCED